MREQPDDDLASALPPSLTVDLHLPDPVHEAPPEEEVVAIEAVGVTAVVGLEATSTHSVEVATGLGIDQDDPAAEPAPDHLRSAESAERGDRSPGRNGRRPRPEGVWPALVYAATVHLVNLGDSRPVRVRKAIDARIGRPTDTARFVAVLSRKGGVGATTIATILGMALADVRQDRVLAIDAHPDRGTLADRVPRGTMSTVRDLVLHAPELADQDALSAHLSRDLTGLEVAASDVDPLRIAAFDGGAYNVVADLAARHFAVVVADAGTGVVQPALKAVLQRADAVVLVSGGGIDEARLAAETLTWLEANGYADLVSNAVVALNASTQATDLGKLTDIEEHFRSRVGSVVRIPYDPALAGGSVVRYAELRGFTRNAARELAADVMDAISGRESAE